MIDISSNNNNLLCNNFKNISLNNNDINNYNEVLFWKVFKNMYLNKYIFRTIEEINDNIVKLNPTIQRYKFNNIKSIRWMLENKAYELLKYKLSIKEKGLAFGFTKRYKDIKILESFDIDILEDVLLYLVNEKRQESTSNLLNITLNILFTRLSIRILKSLIVGKYQNEINNYLYGLRNIKRVNGLIDYYTISDSDIKYSTEQLNRFIVYYITEGLNNKSFNQFIYQYITESKSSDEYLSRLNLVKDNRFQNELPPTWDRLIKEINKCSNSIYAGSFSFNIKTFKWILENSNNVYLNRIHPFINKYKMNFIKSESTTISFLNINEPSIISNEEEEIVSIIQTHQNFNKLIIQLTLEITFAIYSIKLLKLLIEISNNNNKRFHQQINNYSPINLSNFTNSIKSFIDYYLSICCGRNGICIIQLHNISYRSIKESKSNDEYISRLNLTKDNKFKNDFPPTWDELLPCLSFKSNYIISTKETVDWIYNNSNYSILQNINIKKLEFTNLQILEYAVIKLDSTIFRLSHLLMNKKKKDKSEYINHFYSNPYCNAIYNCDISTLQIIDNKYPDFKLTTINLKNNDYFSVSNNTCIPSKDIPEDKVIELFNYLNSINFRVFKNNDMLNNFKTKLNGIWKNIASIK